MVLAVLCDSAVQRAKQSATVIYYYDILAGLLTANKRCAPGELRKRQRAGRVGGGGSVIDVYYGMTVCDLRKVLLLLSLTYLYCLPDSQPASLAGTGIGGC